MEKTLISIEETKKFELERLQNDFERGRFSLVKEV